MKLQNNTSKKASLDIKANMFLVFTLFKFGLKDVSESFTKIFSDFLVTLMRFGVCIWLYSYLFEYKGGSIMGVSLHTVAWSMFLYYALMYINPRSLSTEIQKDIQTGKVEVVLSKPVNYLFYKLGEYLGSRFFTFFISSLFGLMLMIVFLGIPSNMLSLNFTFTFPIVFVLCFILSFELFAILGLLSFWIEDVEPIRWIMDKGTMILGGAYFPIAFFPETLKNISLYSPIGATQFVSHSAYNNWSSIYLKMFLIQIFWIIVFGYILYKVQKSALLKLSVNGG